MAFDAAKIMAYLSALEKNNNREWYHAHMAEYKEADREFDRILSALVFEIGKWDERVIGHEVKDFKFRVARDIRFSRDKTPYNPRFGAHISSKGRANIPVGYAVFLQPGGSFLAGGLYADGIAPATAMIRDYIVAHDDEWEEIITDPEFAALFTVQGTKLKRPPAGYDPDHWQVEHLKHKSWYVQFTVPDGLLLDTDAFVDRAAEVFHIMKPFCDYLNRALEGFSFNMMDKR